MAIIKQIGTDDVGNDFPWFWQTDIICPRCTCAFRLTHEETLPGVVGPIGSVNTLWLGWRQVVEGNALTAALDTANLHIDPAQVYGACPYCGYNPIVIRGPRYGVAKMTIATDPSVGLIQSYVASGAAKMRFVLTHAGLLVGIFLFASGQPYATDATGLYAVAVYRSGPNTLNPALFYPLATPSDPIPFVQVNTLDPAMCAIILRAGLAIT
jgi:hypothetical protein